MGSKETTSQSEASVDAKTDQKEENCSIDDFLSSLDSEHQGNPDGTFYFETDYLALKGNHDYVKLMRALAVLEVQRIKTSQDIDKIENMKLKAKEDPGSVLKDILSGNISLNTRGKIEKVPDIEWSKYKNLCFGAKPPTMTRRRAKKLTEEPEPEKLFDQLPDSVVSSSIPGCSGTSGLLVRGRKYDQNKPETFNQLWTVEEQLRLEQLLVEFPPEPIEWRRWEKISNALGNRTAKQVCSRVQKYFRKLRQVGVSVPGRPSRAVTKPRLVHRRNKHLLYRPTTFFPGIAMNEMTEESESELSNEPDMSHWLHILDVIKEEKTKMDDPSYTPVLHYGYKCMGCNEEPIRGLRWECKTCVDNAVSSCCDCLVSLVNSTSSNDSQIPIHPATHVFQPSYLYTNPHYSTQSYSTNNYLDPNFIA